MSLISDPRGFSDAIGIVCRRDVKIKERGSDMEKRRNGKKIQRKFWVRCVCRGKHSGGGIWRCREEFGEEVSYFVLFFLMLGLGMTGERK